MTAHLVTLLWSTLAQGPLLEVSLQASLRNDVRPQVRNGALVDYYSNRVNTWGWGLSAEAGIALPAGFGLLGTLSIGRWRGGPALPGSFVEDSDLLSATSVRLGPTACFGLPLGKSTLLLEAGPRYHLEILWLQANGFVSSVYPSARHAWAVDAAVSWLYPVGSFLIGVQLSGSGGVEMLSASVGLVLAMSGTPGTYVRP